MSEEESTIYRSRLRLIYDQVFPFVLSALTQSEPSSASTNNTGSGNKNEHLHGEMCSDNSSEIRGWNSQSNMALCFSQQQVSKFAVILSCTSACAPLEGKIPDELQVCNCDWNFKRKWYLSYFHFSHMYISYVLPLMHSSQHP